MTIHTRHGTAIGPRHKAAIAVLALSEEVAAEILAQFDDRARLRVPGPLEVGEFDVMGPSIGSVDDGEGGAGKLVVEAACDQPPDEARTLRLAVKGEPRCVEGEPLHAHGAVDALDDVASLA